MEFKCLICNELFKSNRALATHIRVHNLTTYEYKKKFNLLCYCPSCNKEICCENKSGYCTSCRNRNGENNPFYGKTHSKDTKNILKEKCKYATKKLWKNPDYRKLVLTNMSKPRNEKFSSEQSKRIKEWYKNNPHQKNIRSEYMKKYWEDGTIVKNNYSSNTSKIEKELFKTLKEINKNFKENFTIKIKNKWFFPDIVDTNKKIIIEFFGDYWHCNPLIFNEDDDFSFGLKVKDVWDHDNKRIEILNSFGYKVFIVWENDFKNNFDKILNEIKLLLV